MTPVIFMGIVVFIFAVIMAAITPEQSDKNFYLIIMWIAWAVIIISIQIRNKDVKA